MSATLMNDYEVELNRVGYRAMAMKLYIERTGARPEQFAEAEQVAARAATVERMLDYAARLESEGHIALAKVTLERAMNLEAGVPL